MRILPAKPGNCSLNMSFSKRVFHLKVALLYLQAIRFELCYSYMYDLNSLISTTLSRPRHSISHPVFQLLSTIYQIPS